jgi:hypothetical protein
MPRYNPFKPGSIVNAGMFSGRVEEILTLERVLFQTKNGNADHFLIHGERGIGKSSLLFYTQCIASGEIASVSCGSFNFLVVHIELSPSNNYTDIVRKVGAELQRVVATQNRAKETFKTAWDFLTRWEVNVAGVGVKYSKEKDVTRPQDLLDELTYTIERTLSDMGTERDGILILIDEADKPPHSANLGEFAKVFTERLTKRGCSRVAIGLAGLPVLIHKLQRSHESSPRIFQVLTLGPLLPSERIEVIQKGLDEAKAKNGFEIHIIDEAKGMIAAFSEGYPQFIQQFAHSAFDADQDNMIDVQDFFEGAFKENGAFQQLGVKYFHDLYFDQIGSDEYREVLRAMSDKLDSWVSKEEIRKAANIKESTLTNAIAALKKRNIIIAKEGRSGSYRLPSKSFAVWIKGYTQSRTVNSMSSLVINPNPKSVGNAPSS